MKFSIEPYIHKRTEDLTFVQLSSKAIQIKSYQMPKEGIYVPLLTTDLAQNIKTKEEDRIITANEILRGIVYLLGVDSDFKYKDEYIKLLYAINPNVEKYVQFEAIKLDDDGKTIESIVFLKSLLLLDDRNTQYLYNYGLTVHKYANQNLKEKLKIQEVFLKEATQCFETILDIDVNFALAYYSLGLLYIHYKQFNKSKLYLEKCIELDPDTNLKEEIEQILLEIEDSAKYEKGYEAVLGGRLQEGLLLLLELEDKYPKWWNLLFFIALAYRQLQNYEEAITYFNRVLELDENQLDTLAELGLCYGSLGDYSRARDYFDRALQIAGDDSELLSNMAMVLMEMGNLEEAKEYLDRSLALNSEDEITKVCYERLNLLLEN